MTAALDRSAAELMGGLPGLLPFIAEPFAHVIVSAALHDPDDPDFGARELFVADSGQDRDFALRIWFEASDDQPVKQYWRRMFDAVRAAILGADQ